MQYFWKIFVNLGYYINFKTENMKITVIGSTNIDMCSHLHRLPGPGETAGGGKFMQANGGKGANQAVAAARLGGKVNFITALGDDNFAQQLKLEFINEGIDTSGIITIAGEHTGIALIMIDSNGENCIAVNSGANALLTPQHIDVLSHIIEQSGIIVMQAEIPYETVKHCAKIAKRASVAVLYNPAPVCEVDDEMMQMTDILVVNEHEGAQLSGLNGTAEEIARALHSRGARNVVVTLGKNGSLTFDGERTTMVPSYKVEAGDAVGAGDTFCGALAVAYAEHQRIDSDALRFATAAAALSVTKAGAQTSIPDRATTEAFIDARK